MRKQAEFDDFAIVPDPILSRVFSFLSPEELSKIPSVCKRFNKVSQQTVNLGNGDDNDKAPGIVLNEIKINQQARFSSHKKEKLITQINEIFNLIDDKEKNKLFNQKDREQLKLNTQLKKIIKTTNLSEMTQQLFRLYCQIAVDYIRYLELKNADQSYNLRSILHKFHKIFSSIFDISVTNLRNDEIKDINSIRKVRKQMSEVIQIQAIKYRQHKISQTAVSNCNKPR